MADGVAPNVSEKNNFNSTEITQTTGKNVIYIMELCL